MYNIEPRTDENLTNLEPETGVFSPFVKEVARYFMEFLETNFHRRGVPKRAIIDRNKQNLLIGVSLAKYPQFCRRMWSLLDENKGTLKDLVEPGQYTRAIPEQTLRLLDKKTDLLEEEPVSELHAGILRIVDECASQSTEDVERAVEEARESVSDLIRKSLVEPLLIHLEAPLANIARNDLELVHEAETSLTDIFAAQVDAVLGDAVRNNIIGIESSLSSDLEQVCSVDSCRDAIHSFFSGLAVNDLVFDIQELSDNHRILDKQEIYLNFGTLKFEGRKYPIFYTPLRFERPSGRGFTLLADSPVYVNRKAIEYIVQKFNVQTERHGGDDLVGERILYPGDLSGPLSEVLQESIDRIADYFGLPESVSLRGSVARSAKGLLVQLANEMHFSIFDKSDEALINDYEDILRLIESDDSIASSFGHLIRGFMTENPTPFKGEIGDEWDALSVGDKAVYPSPVPLNSEQRKIVAALRKPKCRYVSVEGPPGTGKSHTITALVCNAVLEHKSVLVLSDKTEALDVVEEKITSTLSNIRLPEEEFQNPILRLGKTGSNFAKVLSQSSLRKIGDHYRAVKSREAQLKTQLSDTTASLKGGISDTVSSLEDVRLGEIRELLELRQAADAAESPVDLEEIFSASSPPILGELLKAVRNVADVLDEEEFQRLVTNGDPITSERINKALLFLSRVNEIQEEQPGNISNLAMFVLLDPPQIKAVTRIVSEYQALTSGVFGKLFKSKKIGLLNAQLQNECQLSEPADLPEKAHSYLRVATLMSQISTDYSELAPVPVLHRVAIGSLPEAVGDQAGDLLDDLNSIDEFASSFPSVAESLGLVGPDLSRVSEGLLLVTPEEKVAEWDRMIALQRKLTSAFAEVPVLDYSSRLEELERLKTHEMAHLLDGRVLKFAEEEQNTAQALKGIIRKRKRFPRDLFGSLREAFPCIIAGIRDYAEYIPLEPELFDLVVIDEASQVSIAQAFPALLRGKQVVIFGDRKQFSNVKAAHAKRDLNLKWKARVREVFLKTVDSDPTHLERVDKFDIKTSILEFFGSISNFDIMLRKYFRGYAEHISYSNKFFYGGELQAIRLRTQSIGDTLRFTVLPDDGLVDATDNVNSREADFILGELALMKEQGETKSVGIITPHTNQQKHIAAKISGHRDREFFIDKLRVKVMTFDTCQGEERDIVFYSMVASAKSDKLWAIFIKDLEKVDLEENGQIKAQRLNVGFSRAKECMHFVLSKNPEEFTGSIGRALAHYESVIAAAAKLPTADDVDPRSPKEVEALQWIQRTRFFNEHSTQIELTAGFPLGKTLKQLDPWYDHPSYKVDFLLMFQHPEGGSEKVVIEYDGFEHHFRDRDFVTDANFDQYYTEDHAERQLVLESYGYKFIRLNRFNCSDDPVKFLNSELERITEKKVGMK